MISEMHNAALEAAMQRGGWEQAVAYTSQRDQLDNALSALNSLLRLGGPPVKLTQKLAEALCEAGRYEEACNLLEAQLSALAAKERAPLQDLLGRVYTKLGQR